MLTHAAQRTCAEALEGRTLLASVTGPLVEWQPVSVDFAGPTSSESSNSPNPFLNYRLQVTFRHGATGKTYNVPGFFDGDGAGGASGNAWRARFTPDEPGSWSYVASFRQGAQVAVSLDPGAGSATSFDGESGSFTVAPRDASAPGFLSVGRLEYAGGHYYKFRDGGYFVKGGLNSPENFLGYNGFDNTPAARHGYSAHVKDWASGDPDWGGGKGKGIIGALNYLSSTGVNSIYFMPMNVGGDAKDTHPWAGSVNGGGSSSNDNLHYDISKLRQWDAVFAHAQRKGVALHVVLNEAEGNNKLELDGGTLGVERKLYYRELTARFGYHNAWQWNISEEYNYKHPLSADAVKQFAQYIRDVDPYDHPITVHAQGDYNAAWSPFLGDDRFDAISYQETASSAGYGGVVQDWRARSAAAGHPIVVSMDELQSTSTSNLESQRERILWPTLLSGGHVEWYASGDDVSLDDFRKFGSLYTWTGHALNFMGQLPFDRMVPADELLTGERTNNGGGQVFALPGEVYAISIPIASNNAQLDLSDGAGKTFTLRWFNPRTGQFEGNVGQVQGGGSVSIGLPPHTSSDDWVLLVRANPGGTGLPTARPGGPYSVPEGGTVRLDGSGSTPFTTGDTLGYAWDLDGDNVFGETGSAAVLGDETTSRPTFNAGSVDGPATRTVRLRVTGGDGQSDTRSATVTVGNVAPTANAGSDKSTVAGSPVTLTGNGADPAAGDVLSYAWSVRNGAGTVVASGASKTLTFTPATAGTYTATLTVTDDDGASDTDTATVTATAPEPQPNSSPAITDLDVPPQVTEGNTLTVAGTFSDPDAHDYYVIEVDWGDGTVESMVVAEQSFSVARRFEDDQDLSVRVTVEDDLGAADTASAPSVVVNAPPSANAGPDRSVTAGTPVALSGSFDDPGDLDTHTFAWQVRNAAGTVVASSTQQAFNFTPTGAGTYTATFTVADDDGGTDSDTVAINATANDGWIASLTLINAETDEPILVLTDGMTLNFATLPTRELNVRADITNGVTVRSVRFGLDANANYRTESEAPFALAGDSDGDYRDWTPTLGAHVLTATPYSGTKASGTKGPAVTINFTVVDQPTNPEPEPEPQPPASPTGLTASPASTTQINLTWTDRATDEQGYVVERRTDATQFAQVASLPAGATTYADRGLAEGTRYHYRVRAINAVGPSAYSNEVLATTFAPEPPPEEEPPSDLLPAVTALWLVDANTDEKALQLVDGMTIRRSDFDVSSFNVVAEANNLTESVRFDYNGANGFRVENDAPFALFGDSDGDFRGQNLLAGTYTITVTPFSENRAGGDAGDAVTVRFTVV